MKRMTIALTLALISLGAADAARACSCAGPPPPGKALTQANAVFLGRVIDITEAESGQAKAVRLRVESSWKGAKCGEVTVLTSAGGAACGYDFQVGQSYVVYAYAEQEQKTLVTNMCTRTNLASLATEDLTALGKAGTSCPGS